MYFNPSSSWTMSALSLLLTKYSKPPNSVPLGPPSTDQYQLGQWPCTKQWGQIRSHAGMFCLKTRANRCALTLPTWPHPCHVPCFFQQHIRNITRPDLAMPGVSSWGCGVTVGTLVSLLRWAALVWWRGTVVRGEQVLVIAVSLSATVTSLSLNVVALSSPACNTTAGAGHRGCVVQLSSSYHTLVGFSN
jgi:hypothetical protein